MFACIGCSFSLVHDILLAMFCFLIKYLTSCQDSSDSINRLHLIGHSSKDYAYKEQGADVERTLMMVSTGIVENQHKDEVSFNSYVLIPFACFALFEFQNEKETGKIDLTW